MCKKKTCCTYCKLNKSFVGGDPRSANLTISLWFTETLIWLHKLLTEMPGFLAATASSSKMTSHKCTQVMDIFPPEYVVYYILSLLKSIWSCSTFNIQFCDSIFYGWLQTHNTRLRSGNDFHTVSIIKLKQKCDLSLTLTKVLLSPKPNLTWEKLKNWIDWT